jgi:hypothetical protein
MANTRQQMDPFGAMAVVFFQETVRGQSKIRLGAIMTPVP